MWSDLRLLLQSGERVARAGMPSYVGRVGRLFLLFVLVPLVDIYLLTMIHGHIGFLNTLALVIATGLLGSWLVRLEGRRAFQSYTRALSEGRMPEEGFLSGAMLLLGGALLVSPGVITDLAGLALLVPWSRRRLANLVRPYLMRRIEEGARRGTIRVVTRGAVVTNPMSEPPSRGQPEQIEAEVVGRRVRVERPRERRVIDAEFEVVDEPT
jgi:UPF0716 protein FxsA